MSLDPVLEVDLLGDGGPTQKADALFYLSKEAFKRRMIDDLWRVRSATSPKSLVTALTSEAVIEQVRKELRRQTGHNIEATELRDLLVASVLRPGCL